MCPRGDLNAVSALRLRQVLVQAIRHLRPSRLIVDLRGVSELDAVDVGAIAAACELGDSYQVGVFLDDAPFRAVTDLAAAGVPHQRLRRRSQG
ncbi:hypothetical protein [Paractinoplanes pyxinae]|uniref:hypothetical protein n=1 Tax=Paractinoplanes pyxinae TaxID=2997416 RepID=UPI002D1E3706|nr:hypothetical protein [Actinoplanes pyxinae]